MAINLNKFMMYVAADNGLNIKELSDKIGRANSSLGISLRGETLSVKDLAKCLKEVGEPLVVTYRGKEFTIEIETI